ncbi:MAG: LPP20 family lipoprotein [Elusimicrobia bacterium]|nr:LPP20 family lipoprotein [Elusimicrobiota bacterium]
MRLRLALLLIAPALFASNPKPDWLSGQSSQYPKSAYIIGVGQDATQDKAADRARTEISKAFSLQLSATSRSSASEVDSGKSSSLSQTTSDDVRTSTRKVLDGVEISSYWDDGKGNVYALAVLNREHALKIITDKLAELDKSVPDLQDQINKSDGKFAKLKLALKLLRLAKSRRHLNADYRVLSPEGKGIPAPEALSGALEQARKAIAAVTIQVETEGVNADVTTSRIMDGLAAYGLKVAEKSGSSADVLVQARSAAQRLEPENITWFWARGSILVKMSYGSTGEVFTRFEEQGSEASRDPSTSVDVTLTKLADQAADHIFKVLTSNDVLDD